MPSQSIQVYGPYHTQTGFQTSTTIDHTGKRHFTKCVMSPNITWPRI